MLTRLILALTLRAGRFAGFVARRRGWIQGVAGVIALTLGFWGWSIEKPPTGFGGVVDNVFRTTQLITLQFPTNLNGVPNLPLQIARLALPIVAVLASFHVLIGSITRPARLALLPRTSGHIVVCGSETLTEAALASLAARGRQVVLIAPKMLAPHRDTLESLGLTIVDGDPLQSSTIKSLHLSHASALFLTSDDDVANLNIAMLALPAVGDRPAALPPLVLAVLIERQALAVELDVALDGLSRRHGVRYHRLCPDLEGIRLELARYAPVLLKNDLDSRSHILVAGLIDNWQQIVAQLIVAGQDHPSKRPLLTFIADADEAAAVQHWYAARPELGLVMEQAILPRDKNELLPPEDVVSAWRQAQGAPQLVVVLRKDAEAVATMLALRRPANLFGTNATPILVRQSKEDRLLPRLGMTQVPGRDMSNLIAIGGLVRAESIERVLDRKGEDTAIALHAHYLTEAEKLGANSPLALQAWDDLPENLRDANRASADHAPLLFAAGGLRLVFDKAAESYSLSSEDLELLARVEHRRWVADRINRGWRYGKTRDDKLMLHPSIVPYEDLSENEREKDRNAVRTLLDVLTQQGLTLVRYCKPVTMG